MMPNLELNDSGKKAPLYLAKKWMESIRNPYLAKVQGEVSEYSILVPNAPFFRMF